MDQVNSGPLARLQADLTAAEAERDERVDADEFFSECLGHRLALNRAEAADANLIALARMYGEACGRLAEYRAAAVEWQREQAEYNAAAEAEIASLRLRVRELEQGAPASPRGNGHE